MKLTLTLITFLIAVLTGYSQTTLVSNEQTISLNYLDSSGNITDDIRKRTFISRTKKIDSIYKLDVYSYWGPLISSKSFQDADMNTLQGHSAFYTGGHIDSAGTYKNNLKEGIWYFREGNKLVPRRFKEGNLFRDYLYDSIKDITPKDSITRVAEFEGGYDGWRNYLVKNFRYPQRARDIDAQGTVVINFMIDKDGTLLNPYVGRSVEMSIDDEALRLIKRSPKWLPAEMEGRKVKCLFSQPVTFRLQ
jgi:protein TonB